MNHAAGEETLSLFPPQGPVMDCFIPQLLLALGRKAYINASGNTLGSTGKWQLQGALIQIGAKSPYAMVPIWNLLQGYSQQVTSQKTSYKTGHLESAFKN